MDGDALTASLVSGPTSGTLTLGDNGSFVYTPAAGVVLNAGAGQTLSVTFTPDDALNYTSANASVLINVLQATPVITWPTPADIVYGTALSAAQLNATTTVPGSRPSSCTASPSSGSTGGNRPTPAAPGARSRNPGCCSGIRPSRSPSSRNSRT